jgi:hypothetical protein
MRALPEAPMPAGVVAAAEIVRRTSAGYDVRMSATATGSRPVGSFSRAAAAEILPAQVRVYDALHPPRASRGRGRGARNARAVDPVAALAVPRPPARHRSGQAATVPAAELVAPPAVFPLLGPLQQPRPLLPPPVPPLVPAPVAPRPVPVPQALASASESVPEGAPSVMDVSMDTDDLADVNSLDDADDEDLVHY